MFLSIYSFFSNPFIEKVLQFCTTCQCWATLSGGIGLETPSRHRDLALFPNELHLSLGDLRALLAVFLSPVKVPNMSEFMYLGTFPK